MGTDSQRLVPGDTTGGLNRLPAILNLIAVSGVLATDIERASISSNVSIRIFEKLFGIHEVMFNLVEADKTN